MSEQHVPNVELLSGPTVTQHACRPYDVVQEGQSLFDTVRITFHSSRCARTNHQRFVPSGLGPSHGTGGRKASVVQKQCCAEMLLER